MGRREKNEVKKKKKLKVFLWILVIVLAILAALVVYGWDFLKSKLNLTNRTDLDESNLSLSENDNLGKYKNIAIFGVDSRDDDYGVGNRSDCIIIASMNNKTHDVKLVSVYRDTYVNIEGHGLDKITHAYSYGGPELAIKTLNENLDLNITEFVTVTFDAVADAVDELGGVEIDITSEETKYINSYIDATAKITGKSAGHITTSGKHTLNGVQAVAYSRIRYTDGGDYKRTERMRDVITAMLKKLKSKSLGEINKFADNILPEIYTNLTSSDIIALVPYISSFNIDKSIGWPYDVQGITLDRWYGVPVTLKSNVEQLHAEVFEDENYTVPENIDETNKKIINKTGYSN